MENLNDIGISKIISIIGNNKMNQAKFLNEFLDKYIEINEEDIFENNKIYIKFFNLLENKNKGLFMNFTIDNYEYKINEEEFKKMKNDDEKNKYIYEKKQEMKIGQKFMKSFISNNSNLVIFFIDENEKKNYIEKIIKTYEFDQQLYIIHCISDKNKERDIIKKLDNFSSATHTNFPSKNNTKKGEKYYIEDILDNKCENKKKQIIHYIYYENEKEKYRNEDLFNTINAKFKTANSNIVNFMKIFKNHLELYLNQIYQKKVDIKEENNLFKIRYYSKIKNDIIGDLIKEKEEQNIIKGFYNSLTNNMIFSMESITDDIKIKGEKKNGYNILDIYKNIGQLKEKDILFSSITNKTKNDKIYIPIDKGNIDKFNTNNKVLKDGYFQIIFPLTVFDNQTYTVMLEEEEESDDKERLEESNENENEESEQNEDNEDE